MANGVTLSATVSFSPGSAIGQGIAQGFILSAGSVFDPGAAIGGASATAAGAVWQAAAAILPGAASVGAQGPSVTLTSVATFTPGTTRVRVYAMPRGAFTPAASRGALTGAIPRTDFD
jgi:hypothetical protein